MQVKAVYTVEICLLCGSDGWTKKMYPYNLWISAKMKDLQENSIAE